MATQTRPPEELFKPGMGTIRRIGGALWAGLRLTLGHLLIPLFVCLPPALVLAPIDGWIGEALTHAGASDQMDLVKAMLGWTVVYLVFEVFYGPLIAASAVYVTKSWAEGRRPGLYKAVNFALNRYKRQFLPHLGAQLSIQLGMVVLIPGIYFMCMYAFVDPVACLEDEKWAMARSKKLTRGRRKAILWVAMPFILVSQVNIFVELYALQHGVGWLVLDFWALLMLLFFQHVAFTWLYLERTVARKASAPKAAPDPA